MSRKKKSRREVTAIYTKQRTIFVPKRKLLQHMFARYSIARRISSFVIFFSILCSNSTGPNWVRRTVEQRIIEQKEIEKDVCFSSEHVLCLEFSAVDLHGNLHLNSETINHHTLSKKALIFFEKPLWCYEQHTSCGNPELYFPFPLPFMPTRISQVKMSISISNTDAK